MTAVRAPTRPADPALELVSVHWERIQIVIRARRSSLDLEDGRLLHLERTDRTAAPMPPTRVWADGDDILVRFNVMQGPDQDPLAPGRWTLTMGPRDARTGTQPVRIVDPSVLDPASDTAIFNVDYRGSRIVYRFVPRIDPVIGSLSLIVSVESTGAGHAPGDQLRGLRWRTIRAIRGAGAAVGRGVFAAARAVVRRNGHRILFISGFQVEASGNLKLVRDRMVARGLDREYELVTRSVPRVAVRQSRRESLRTLWSLLRSDVIVLDDYQPIVYRVDIDRDVKIVQLWHASGPFKTVGYSRIGKAGGPLPWSRVHKNYTHAIVSSDADVPYYAEAFGIPESRVIPTGIPRMDRYFDDGLRAAGREAALEAYPAARDRMTILFAPTFRGDGHRQVSYDLSWIDYPALHALAISKDAVVILRMHPFVREPLAIPEALADRLLDGSTSSIDVNDLLLGVDLLITDYSSIVFEYSTLGRPMLFYTPDLEDYLASRDVYEPFETFVPGRIVRSFDELVDAIRHEDFEVERVAAFAERHFSHLDGASTDRVIDEVILAR